jgi:hypothetical protein
VISGTEDTRQEELWLKEEKKLQRKLHQSAVVVRKQQKLLQSVVVVVKKLRNLYRFARKTPVLAPGFFICLDVSS